MEITDWLKKGWTGSGATFRFPFFSLPLIDFIFISIFFFFFWRDPLDRLSLVRR